MAGRPKREVRKPQRLIEFLRDNRPNNEKKTSRTKRDQSLYDIEVTEVDRERKRLKIHYVGYSEAHDEWRPYDEADGEYFPFIRNEKLILPTQESIEDRTQCFYNTLYREIKKKLWSSRREDPEISIDLNCDQDVFEAGLVLYCCWQNLQRKTIFYYTFEQAVKQCFWPLMG